MKAIFDERQLKHNPERYFRRGAYMPHPEQPERAILIRDMLIKNDFPIETPQDYGLDPIKAVHDEDYVEFWKDAYERWVAEAGDAEPIPNYHPGRKHPGRRSSSIFGQLGWYATDTSVPLTEGTFEAIYWSAQTAIEAAERVVAGDRLIYGLCRPPGHHAMTNGANGFCIFNNAAVAAQVLRKKFDKVAVFDIDTHTGNGTLDIFYDRSDVMVCSLHVDPDNYSTFYLGYPDETGEGDGVGATLNLCLKSGSTEDEVLVRFREGVEALKANGTEALVISLGFDMAHDDPLSEVGMTGKGFEVMAREIVRMGLPTVLIQEGGYLGPSLSDNAEVFLTAARDEAGS
ncbi:MAG: histone deacetylase family protein [Rhodobacteraceae bacterium]|nr:histone deacetylase family protein [Paracoccaceae bacterium]